MFKLMDKKIITILSSNFCLTVACPYVGALNAHHSFYLYPDPNRLTLIMLLKEFFLKSYFERKLADDNKSMKNYPNCLQRLSADASFGSWEY